MDSPEADVERTLIALQTVALCCLGMAAVLRIIDFAQSGTGVAVAIIWLILIPFIAALWVVRPRLVQAGHGVAPTVAAVTMATPVAVFGTLGFTIPVLLLIVAFAVVDVSPKAGLQAMIWISGAGFILLISDNLSSWETLGNGIVQALINVVPVAVLLCFGIALGLALRSFEQRREADRDVIDRLRHTSEIEKELLLSDERARSARELHDGLGHHLTLVSMSLELAERMRTIDPSQAWEEIRMARDISSEALAEMRKWVRALSPVRDASARGLAALELIAESFRGTGVNVEVCGNEESDQVLSNDDATALVIYRAVQEGLTNALRHSKARKIRVEIATEEQQLVLTVNNAMDRTIAPQLAEGQPVLGFGLRGLADRAAERGGSMYAGRIGEQFTLTISLPLQNSYTVKQGSPS